MAIPTVFSPILPQDFTLTPIRVNKKFELRRSDLYSGSTPNTASGYKIWEALQYTEPLKIDTRTYPTNSWDNSYKSIIWNFIDHRYYRIPYDKFNTVEHANRRFTYKFLYATASVIVLPQQDFGEQIQPGSLEITGSGWNLTDDKNGNIYVYAIDTGSFPNRSNLSLWLNPNLLIRKIPSTTADYLYTGTTEYLSNTHVPVNEVEINRIRTRTSASAMPFTDNDFYINPTDEILDDIGSTVQRIPFIRIPWDENIVDTGEDWTLYIKHFIDLSDQDVGYGAATIGTPIISKRSIVRRIHNNGIIHSASVDDAPTNVYPFEIGFYRSDTSEVPLHKRGKCFFRMSNGSQTFELTGSSVTAGDICVTKNGSSYKLYQSGTLAAQATSSLGHIYNSYDIMIGSADRAGRGTGYIHLYDFKIFNTALTAEQVSTLSPVTNATQYYALRNTTVVGNVFYKTGTVVLSTPKQLSINQLFSNDFTLKYRGTHTIYQYEILSRIKKGSFNLTLNPSARRTPKSDLLIDDFTGSLYPYASTIGYYNDRGELLAVGKLSQPLQMREDTQINIIARFDV